MARGCKIEGCGAKYNAKGYCILFLRMLTAELNFTIFQEMKKPKQLLIKMTMQKPKIISGAYLLTDM